MAQTRNTKDERTLGASALDSIPISVTRALVRLKKEARVALIADRCV